MTIDQVGDKGVKVNDIYYLRDLNARVDPQTIYLYSSATGPDALYEGAIGEVVVNGETPLTGEEMMVALEFIGNFKSGGSDVSGELAAVSEGLNEKLDYLIELGEAPGMFSLSEEWGEVEMTHESVNEDMGVAAILHDDYLFFTCDTGVISAFSRVTKKIVQFFVGCQAMTRNSLSWAIACSCMIGMRYITGTTRLKCSPGLPPIMKGLKP